MDLMTGSVQPDRDEPRRFIITGNRHGRQGRLDSPLVEVVEGPPIQMGEHIEVVESREPFPSDKQNFGGTRQARSDEAEAGAGAPSIASRAGEVTTGRHSADASPCVDSPAYPFEPFPSDEAVEAGARALFALEQDPAPWDALSETGKEALRKGARAVLDAVSSHRDGISIQQENEIRSHRDDEARELERIRTWLADHDALDGAVADSAIELFEALTRSIRDYRAVSDVVEELRNHDGGKLFWGDAIEHIEKWAADRKAGT